MSVAEADETYAEPVASRVGLKPGAQLGRFTLRRVLGEGGMGVVWAAHDPDLDREIAIKVLRHTQEASPALRKRLLREARAMARLKHPNVIVVYEVGSAGDVDFIAMELVEGSTMDNWLTLAPPEDDVWRAIIAAGRGLAAAHAAGLVHRDFKPHNVLRSRDGRVLVTDFGLARGLGEESVSIVEPQMPATAIALDETLDAVKTPASRQASQYPWGAPSKTPSRTDSVLDSPLTQTGVLIGTPAYMAPEQFVGAEPDPRTDQFAFCVSAWQALTGARPFVGDTLEELRQAASKGVEAVIANLPKSIRAVLARGLDPDPAKRWPDLDALLDALERSRKPRRPLWPIALASAVVAVAVVFVIAKRTDSERVNAGACAPAEVEFAEAWSDQSRTALVSSGRASDAAIDRTVRAFDQFRTRWTASYQEACNAPRSKQVDARLACLRGVRDQTVAIRLMLHSAERNALEAIDLHGMLPNMAVCNGPMPVAPPEVPRDQPRRAKVLELFARVISLRGVPHEALSATTQQLLDDANKVGWKPIMPMIQATVGNIYLRHRDYERARIYFHKAVETAGEDIRFEAIARVGLLEASINELEKPGYGDVPPRPGVLHEELARLLTYARSAVRGSGNDPMLVGAVALLEAQAHANLNQWSRFRQPYKNALANAAEARREFEKAGDLRRSAQVAAFEAEIYLLRGNERSLDDALYVARFAEEMLSAASLEPVPALDELRGRIAFAKSEYREAHERFDRLARRRPEVTGVAKRGRVVDKAGTGIKATVVTWRGELHGDPLRAFTDPRFDGEVIETNADGTFEFRGGDAIVAETTDLRSAARPADNNLTLVVEPTTTIHGSVTPAIPLVDAYARYTIGSATWFIHAPVAKNGEYRLDGIPSPTRQALYTLGAIGPAGNGTRRIAATDVRMTWPTGRTVEVIVRAKNAMDDTARTWIFRGRVTAKTREEVETLASKTIDVATSDFHPIGSDATEAGREIYVQGDRHAIVVDNAEGETTACIALTDLPNAPAHCTTIVLEAAPKDDSVNPGVVPVLFKTD